MFENTPLLRGNYLTYAEYLALYQTGMALGLSLMFFFSAFFWRLILDAVKIKLNKKWHYEGSCTCCHQEEGTVSCQHIKTNQINNFSQRSERCCLTRFFKLSLLEKMPNILQSIGWIGLACSPSQIFSMGLISKTISVSSTFFVLSYRIILTESSERNMPKGKIPKNMGIYANILRRLKLVVLNKRKSIGIKCLLALLLALFVNLLFENTCLAIYNDSFGIHINPVVNINTKLTRYFQISEVCPPGPPCHIYATVPEDASNAVFINVHTSLEVESLIIEYAKLADYRQNNKTIKGKRSFPHRVDYIESRADRMVHTVLLDNLEANTLYKLFIYYHGKFQAERTYLTPPELEENEMRLIFGGDIGPSLKTDKMNQVIAEHKPHALFLGGDLAYDNNLKGCYYSYDMFLHKFEDLFEKMGYLIPMVLALGNHDIGLNSYSSRSLVIDDQTSLYFTYFPQHYSLGSNGQKSIPKIHERKSVFHHIFGKNLVFSLDSGYLHKLDTYQPEYINNVSKEYPYYNKFAQYHRPIRPVCKGKIGAFENDGLAFWEPIFQRWKFSGVFENHAHTIKRTKKLGEPSSNEKIEGVMYFGEGSWGSNPNKCKFLDKMDMMEVSGHINHVWSLTLSNEKNRYAAIGFEPNLLTNYQGDF